jgi:hypothetical protein
MRHHPCCRTDTLQYDWSMTTDRTVHNNSQGSVVLDKIIQAAHSVDAVIPNSDKFHSTITENLHVLVYTDVNKGSKIFGN